MLGPSCCKQQKLRHWIGRTILHDKFANIFTDRGASGLPCHDDGYAGVLEALGQTLRLGGFSSSLSAFESNEFSALHGSPLLLAGVI
jgi:hypothetical protein